MGAKPAVTVARRAAECEADPAALHQAGERLPRLRRKPQSAGSGLATPRARRLDAGKPHRLPVVEQDRAAVDDRRPPAP